MSALRTVGDIREPATKGNKKWFNQMAQDTFWLEANLNLEEVLCYENGTISGR